MKKLFIIITLFLLILNPVFSKSAYIEKEYKVAASDGFNIVAKLVYPNQKSKKEFKSVILLHSLGYSSQWWESLPKDLLESGYAVLFIDFRGHGESVYNSRLVKTSWKSLNNSGFAKYPDDVYRVLQFISKDNVKRKFFDDYAVIGADIGSSIAILSSDMMDVKPKTIVLLSPIVETKGLYVPVKLANLNFDILSLSGTGDIMSQDAEKYLQKFAQASFATYVSESKSTGMLMLKHDKTLSKVIISWIKQYL